MNDIYDVAVIGGGPAGAVFARELSLSRPDFKLLLVDGQNEDNKKVCGGLLSPDAQRAFARLGLTLPKNILSDPQIFDVETVDLVKKQVRYYQRHYLNMDRYAFDKWLISLIPQGVVVYNGRCISVSKENGCIKLRLKSAEGEIEVQASSLVGADGANSTVRRTFFDCAPMKYVALQQHFKCTESSLPPYSCIFDPVTSDSCSWTIRKDGYMVFGGAFKKHNCKEAFDLQRQRFEDFLGISLGEPIKTEACLLTSPRRMKDFQIGKDNIYLIGEAAGFISASSFEGISNAVLSGKFLSEAFVKGKDCKDVLRLYRKRTFKLKMKLFAKIQKRWVLCSPFLRSLIMKSGIQSIQKYDAPTCPLCIPAELCDSRL